MNGKAAARKKSCSQARNRSKMKLFCDPQCQKLKTTLERIHKGLEDKAPFYNFCGKIHPRGGMSHPFLDRNAKRPPTRNTAIMKTIDNTKISIKANTLVINCTKDNYQNILNKIDELKITEADVPGTAKGSEIKPKLLEVKNKEDRKEDEIEKEETLEKKEEEPHKESETAVKDIVYDSTHALRQLQLSDHNLRLK
ncbi:uncharacterized protein LOC103512159 isoform X1 [Diaphorina citri]|uniref:Uncharacterized protein LOC103512159 isoform X1 n=1 Tax=Diaphorina citri TaxID=121845 RepID=A0A1S3D5Z5_DIACI|nr:uncharacterized protein LOC103512159 isoform X1 [Diaphorina citri]